MGVLFVSLLHSGKPFSDKEHVQAIPFGKETKARKHPRSLSPAVLGVWKAVLGSIFCG